MRKGNMNAVMSKLVQMYQDGTEIEYRSVHGLMRCCADAGNVEGCEMLGKKKNETYTKQTYTTRQKTSNHTHTAYALLQT